MEKTVQRLHGFESLKIFGVRHLSPASAFHLLRFLEEQHPKYLLIEGPSDGNDFLPQIADVRIKPPFALLSYTTESPVQTVLYPFAEYAPEYCAICWAYQNRVPVRFMDLPTSAFIRLDTKDTGSENDYHSQLRQLSGEPDFDSFWERNFEHCGDMLTFMDRMKAFAGTLREYEAFSSYNLVREAFMKNQIQQVMKDGYAPEEIVVVTGAYHVSGLQSELVPMTEKEINKLPKESVKMTLMPYSNYRLSQQSGYGAGNKAPEYFRMLWHSLKRDTLHKLPSLYLSSIGAGLRAEGNYSSTASVIEAVRLSEGLAGLRDSRFPSLKDLHDGAVCLFGAGELAAVAKAFALTDVGTAIGELPEGLSQTPVQEDMKRMIKKLKLEKYKSTVAQELTLDLRENRKVKSQEAAFMDLNRSIFFNRLLLLNIHFASLQAVYNASSWSEKWIVRWTPESEIELVEATLKGETIENAAAFEIKERLEQAKNIVEIAKILGLAFVCNLLSEVPNALARLQALCTEAGSFVEVASACLEIANIIEYRDVRNVDASRLNPVLAQLFLRGSLILYDGALCDDAAAAEYIKAIDNMHNVSQRLYEQINDELWVEGIRKTASSDNRNSKISGAATALLLERNLIADADFKVEMSRRLSAGTPSDIAALWFEGLSLRNRYALLSRSSVWQQLDEYLDSLDQEAFRRALVFLRRSFGSFTPNEKNAIVEILADLWQVQETDVSEYLQQELSEDEQENIDALNEFDFDF